MKATLKRLISSSTTTIVLLLVYGAGLAIATFIEKYQGSEVARSVVYCSPLFFLLQFLIVLNCLSFSSSPSKVISFIYTLRLGEYG